MLGAIGLRQTVPDIGQTDAGTLEISRSMSNRKLEAEVQYFLGNIYYETADYGRATDALEEAKSIWQSTGNTLGLARSLFYLAVIDSDMSRFDTGPIRAEQALSLFQSLENKQGEARTLTLLGHFQLRMGRKQEALNMYERARPLVIDSGDLFMEATLLNSIETIPSFLSSLHERPPLVLMKSPPSVPKKTVFCPPNVENAAA